MLVRYVGPRTRVRLVDGYRWGPENGYRQHVPAKTAFALLANPGWGGEDYFEVDPEEPLLQVVSAEQVGLLAAAGVGSVEDLAGVRTGQEVRRVARELGLTQTKTRELVTEAQALPAVEDVEVELDGYRGCCD